MLRVTSMMLVLRPTFGCNLVEFGCDLVEEGEATFARVSGL